MRIALDVTPLSLPRTGIGNYLRGLVGALLDVPGDHDLVAFAVASPPGRRAVDAALARRRVDRRFLVLPFARAWRAGWSRLAWPPVERLVGRVDVLHFSDWMFPPQRDGLRATTIYDLVPLRFPRAVHPRTLALHSRKYEHAARTCDVIFVISQYTRGDVVDRLGVPPDRIRVAYPGVAPLFRREGAPASLRTRYVLTVSTMEPRKNLETLVTALALVRKRTRDLELVVVGAPGWGNTSPLGGPGVQSLGFVPDEQLAALYRSASVFAYPSRFEGFGLPVVEAMASGAPTVVSSHPSLDEASGEAALRADPSSAEDFAAAIERALEEREALVERGLEHAAKFTWRRCAEAVLAGYVDARAGAPSVAE